MFVSNNDAILCLSLVMVAYLFCACLGLVLDLSVFSFWPLSLLAWRLQSELRDVKYDKEQLANKCHELEAVSICLEVKSTTFEIVMV